MVALRSVFALLDLPDGADSAAVDAAAARLERSLVLRQASHAGADDLADALRRAIAATRVALDEGRTDWYFGGTEADVDDELSRVVEHLMVVVGVVSPAEQRRLVLDAQLLGLSADRAQARVRDLVLRAQASRLQEQLSAIDVGTRIVHLHPALGRFVLDGSPDVAATATPAVEPGGASGGDATVDTDAIRMRVLLDVR
jgi:hypothetical protein